MLNKETLKLIVGIIGNVISFSLYASPIPTILKIHKARSVMSFKPDPYLATFLNCAMWGLYGMPFINPGNILVLTINATGLTMEFAYIVVFLIYSEADKRKKIGMVFVLEIVFFAILILISLNLLHTTKSRTFMVGIICIIITIIMYASPLTVMQRVIKTKSVKYMPVAVSIASLCNGVIWLTYALFSMDFFILLPNTLGAISSVVQVVLYIMYYKTTNWDEEDEEEAVKPPKEVQLADAV